MTYEIFYVSGLVPNRRTALEKNDKAHVSEGRKQIQ